MDTDSTDSHGFFITGGNRKGCPLQPGLINALMKMLVVSHEAQRSGVQEAQNGTPLALRA